jgi:hypothetical protein
MVGADVTRSCHRIVSAITTHSWAIALALVVMGCTPAPMTNTIVAKAQSPDGASIAVLVDRYIEAARVSDGWFLIVVPAGRSLTDAINARNIGESAALVATNAARLRLHWQDSETLVVVCNSCGLQAIDISKKLDRLGATKIVYQGFPEHTAYS